MIKSLIARYLGVGSRGLCSVVEVKDWIHGSFNVCIQVDIFGLTGVVDKQVIFNLAALSD